jgi:hypothetical protein
LSGGYHPTGDIGGKLGDRALDVISGFAVSDGVYVVNLLKDFRVQGSKHLTFGDFIVGDHILTGAFKAIDVGISFVQVFLTYTAVDPLTPKVKTASF